MSIEHPILSIDYGAARIGLAATDELGIGVHPAGTILTQTQDPIKELESLISTRRIKTIVLGLPLRMDGSLGKSAEKVQHFGSKIKTSFPAVSLYYTDESFSSIDAAEKLHQAGKNAKKQKAIIDQAAAMEILHRFLEENSLL